MYLNIAVTVSPNVHARMFNFNIKYILIFLSTIYCIKTYLLILYLVNKKHKIKFYDK